jgi:hypothetical protein
VLITLSYFYYTYTCQIACPEWAKGISHCHSTKPMFSEARFKFI